MKKQFEFAGISGAYNKEEVSEKWDEGIPYYFETKKRYQHDDYEMSHEYLYGIEVIDMGEACGEEGFEIILYYIVSPKSISRKMKDEIMVQFDNNFKEEFISWYDIMQEGGAVQLGHKHAKDEEEMEDVLLEAMASVDAIDGLRGFYLDKSWNMIGTTGWDSIEFALGHIDSPFGF